MCAQACGWWVTFYLQPDLLSCQCWKIKSGCITCTCKERNHRMKWSKLLFVSHQQVFLDYTKEGSSFVFGSLIENIFAFQVSKSFIWNHLSLTLLDVCNEFCFFPQALPIVVFFSSIMSVLYFLGIMQWIILKVKTCAAQHRRLL